MGRKVLALTAVGLLVAALAGPVAAAGGTVKMGESNNRYFFGPATTYVNVGGAVTWTNGTDASHTVTSDSGSELASSTIAAGATFSHTFATAGTFSYHCTIHPYMTAKVVVLAAGATPPPTDAIAPTAPAAGSPIGGLVVLPMALGAVLFLRRIRARS